MNQAVQIYRDPREAMRAALPAAVQPFLTWLTAKPAKDERYVRRSNGYHLATSLFLVIAGLALSVATLIWSGAAILLLPFGLLATSSGISRFQVLIYHYCAHRAVFRRRRLNDIVGQAVSTAFLFKNFAEYRREHLQHHQIGKLFRDDDEFVTFLTSMLQLKRGDPKGVLWRKVLSSFASPLFHGRFLLSRLRSTFISPYPVHNLCASLYWGSLLFAVSAAGQWGVFLIVWVIPLTILTHISTALRILCEHRWLPPGSESASTKAKIGLSTAAVFPGAPPPSGQSGLARPVAWVWWWARMATVHLFTRVFVLVGDAPCHDYHHRRPARKDWASFVHARAQDAARGCPGFPVDYIETWGMVAAIDANLDAFARSGRGRA